MKRNTAEDIPQPQRSFTKNIKIAFVVCLIATISVSSVSTRFNEYINATIFSSPDTTIMNTTSSLSTWYYILGTLGIYHIKSPIVNTSLGSVQGIVSRSRDGRDFYEYRGIPYGQAPINELRFESPVPAKPWEGVRQADEWGPMCLQFDAMLRGVVIGEEDCLYLNVFTNDLNPGKQVLVYIHGGGFTGGESMLFNPKYLMDEGDLVVVTLNYRLASLGFLNTGDELIRGNMGLKDQNLALKFISENIKHFGGDEKQITLFGESAGGASVHYHIISPLSRGLFHKAIIQSGNVACPWALTRNPQKQALRFGKLLNCPVDNTTVLVDCLKKMDPKDIVKQHAIILSPIHLQDDFFPGSIEAIKRDDTFLSENPFDMLERGDFAHIPVIFGMNAAEGGLKTARLEAYPTVLGELNEKWNEYVPILMHYDPNRTNVSDKLREHYFPNEPNELVKRINPAEDLESLTKMLSHGIFFEASHKVAKYHSKYAPTYLYYYNYTSAAFPSMYSLIRAAKPKRPWQFNVATSVASDYADKYVWSSKDPRRFGPCHAEDIPQVWSVNIFTDIRRLYSDYPFSKEIVRCFIQFARNESNLHFYNVSWPAINPGDSTHLYMKMDNEAKVIEEPFRDGVAFIESLNIRDPQEINNW